MTKATFMPSEEALKGEPFKIAVFKFEENDNEVAKQAALGASLASRVEMVIGKNRLGKIVDRKAVTKLQQEVALAEMNQTGSYKGPQVADYAISGEISNAGFTSKYSNTSTCFDPLSRQVKPIPPHFEYSSDVVGSIKVYELPSLAVIESIELNGSKTRNENVKKSGGLDLGVISFGGTSADAITRDDDLVRKAGESAIESAESDIKNFFSKRGFIMEKRSFEDKIIFKINIGSVDGLQHGDKLEISGQYEVENSITEKSEVEARIIASGTVTQLIDPKVSWIVVNDAEKANSIRLGDAVKMKYKKSFMHSGTGKMGLSLLGKICGAK